MVLVIASIPASLYWLELIEFLLPIAQHLLELWLLSKTSYGCQLSFLKVAAVQVVNLSRYSRDTAAS